MTLVRLNPARELLNVEKEFSRLWDNFEKRFGFPSGKDTEEEFENAVWMPLTDISEDNENFFLNMDIPGVNKEDVKISFNNGQLTISGERKQDKESKDSKYHRVERIYGKYYRSFTLPSKIQSDKIEASFKDGSLLVTIPKAEDAKPKEIEIKVK